MLQFYFLAVICSVLTGLYFASTPFFNERIPEKMKLPLLDGAFVLCAVTGILKLFLVVQPDIVILGDLLPAISCLLAAFCLFLEIYEVQAGKTLALPKILTSFFGPETGESSSGAYRKYIGYLLMIIGVLHFFMPAVRMF